MLRQARRPAFATTFEAAGPGTANLVRQWQRKQLQLIGIAGASPAEQERQLLRFLDRLAEQVAVQAPRLVLAPDVDVAPPLAWLRRLLVDQVGKEVEAVAEGLARTAESAGVVRFLAQVLEFLTSQGWRPRHWEGGNLCRLWEHLADRAATLTERRRLLIAALGSAEGFADVSRLRDKLAEATRD